MLTSIHIYFPTIRITGSNNMQFRIRPSDMKTGSPFDKELIREMFDLKSKEKSPTLQKL